MNLTDCLIYNLCKTSTLTFHVKQAVFFSSNQERKFVGSYSCSYLSIGFPVYVVTDCRRKLGRAREAKNVRRNVNELFPVSLHPSSLCLQLSPFNACRRLVIFLYLNHEIGSQWTKKFPNIQSAVFHFCWRPSSSTQIKDHFVVFFNIIKS